MFGIVVNKHAQRFYDEGEDIWPKRYAIWGRLVAAQPDQIAYIIFDAQRRQQLHAVAVSADRGADASPNSPASSELDPAALEKTVSEFNAAVQPGTFDPHILDDCRTEGIAPPKTHWARQDRDAALSTPIRCGPASPSPISAPA